MQENARIQNRIVWFFLIICEYNKCDRQVLLEIASCYYQAIRVLKLNIKRITLF